MRKKAVVGVVVAASLAVAGIAFAAWTANGTGDGTAVAGSAQAVTVTSDPGQVVNELYPTGSGDVVVIVDNPNPFAVNVSEINGNGPITSGDATCDASNGVTYADQTVNQDIAAGGSHTFVLTNAASMDNTSVDACQGQTFTVPVEVLAASAP